MTTHDVARLCGGRPKPEIETIHAAEKTGQVFPQEQRKSSKPSTGARSETTKTLLSPDNKSFIAA
jgi:hypothetical protein